ncbi:MAG: hypothetical protein ACYCV0_15840 [Desulfitobacteriaceae bacterium]
MYGYGWSGYGAVACTRVGLGQVPGPGGPGTLRPWVCRGVEGGYGVGVGVGIIAIAILILIALGVIF